MIILYFVKIFISVMIKCNEKIVEKFCFLRGDFFFVYEDDEYFYFVIWEDS